MAANRQAAQPVMPRLLQAIVQSFQQPDIRRRLLFTLGLLVVFRFVAHVPIPGTDSEQPEELRWPSAVRLSLLIMRTLPLEVPITTR